MSGGFFDYDQYRITTIAESIESVIEKNFKPIEPKDKWGYWDDRKYYYEYPDEIIERFKEAVKILKMANVYAHRIDWLLSGDDGEENFIKRLESELNNIEK